MTQSSASTNAFKRDKKGGASKSPVQVPAMFREDTSEKKTHKTSQYQTKQSMHISEFDASHMEDEDKKEDDDLSGPDDDTPQGEDEQEHLFENSSQDNVKVVVRVRPLSEKEERNAQGKNRCLNVESGTILLDRGFDVKKFNFDYVGQENIEQSVMFNHIAKPIADSCMQGYNGTIFAYGQTGSGKTYTIQGPSGDMEVSSQNCRGIMQRSFEYIFENQEA